MHKIQVQMDQVPQHKSIQTEPQGEQRVGKTLECIGTVIQLLR